MRLIISFVLAFVAIMPSARAGDPVPRTPPLPGRVTGIEHIESSPWSYSVGMGPEQFITVGAADEYRRAKRYNLEATMCPTDAQKFCVKNFGNKSVAFNIWDPSSLNWMVFEVPALDRTEVHCGKCQSKARISFHNGRDQSVYWVMLGRLLKVDWSENEKVWILKGETEDVLALDQ